MFPTVEAASERLAESGYLPSPEIATAVFLADLARAREPRGELLAAAEGR